LGEAKNALDAARGSGDKAVAAEALRLVILAQKAEADKISALPVEAERTAREELPKLKSDADSIGEASVLLALSEIGYSQSHYKAEAQVTQAASIFQEAGNKKLHATSCIHLAFLKCLDHDPKEGEEKAREGLALAKEVGARREEASAMHIVALALKATKQYSLAHESAETACDMWHELGLETMQVQELCLIAQIFLAQDKPQAALSRAKEAAAIKTGNSSTQVLVDALIAKSQVSDAVTVAKDSLQQLQESGDQKAEVIACQILARVQLLHESFDGAVNSLEQALGIMRDLGDQKEEMMLMRVLADAQVKASDVSKAVQSLQEAQTLADKLSALSQKGAIMRRKAEVQQELGMLQDAETTALEASEICHQVGDRTGEINALTVLAGIHSSSGDIDAALKVARQANELAFVSMDLPREAKVLQLLVEMYMSKQNYESALEAAERSVAVWKESADPKGESSAKRTLSNLYLSFGMIGESEAAAYQAFELAKVAGDDEGAAAALLQLASTYVTIYDFEDKTQDVESPTVAKLLQATSEAMALARKAGNILLRAVSSFWRAYAIMWSGKNPKDAQKLAMEAQKCFKKMGDADEVYAWLLLANINLAIDKRDRAKDFAEKAISVAQSNGDSKGEAMATEMLDRVQNSSNKATPSVQRRSAAPAPGSGEKQALETAARPTVDRAVVHSKLMDIVRNILASDDDVAADEPLMDAGLDSLSSVDFTSAVAREFSIGSSPSLVFDFPSVRGLIGHIMEETSG